MADSCRQVGDLFVKSELVRIAFSVLIYVNHSQPAATTNIILTNLKSLIPQPGPLNPHRLIVSQVPLH